MCAIQYLKRLRASFEPPLRCVPSFLLVSWEADEFTPSVDSENARVLCYKVVMPARGEPAGFGLDHD
ncbi:MAG: hypothetical protein JWN45_3415 [Acidobacteriaceae bacterium]|nr:hypothetical protein [Acidobacteriaceae bacterium]